MTNMMDYLKWRGDLTFENDPFNEVDNVIFSELVYVDFSGIVPELGVEDKISLKEASRLFFASHSENEILQQVSSTKMAAFVMKEMAKTKRFSDIMLSQYVDDVSLEKESQFCAMTIEYVPGQLYVVFSGTDRTIVGWKENFNMGFLSETPGQLRAVNYLESVLRNTYEAVYVGGHSKGGNLAVYGMVNADAAVQDKITKVYNNDGPGFSLEVVESSKYQKVLDKIQTIIPESSIVGMLLEHGEAYEVVKSKSVGPLSHDALNWEIEGAHFVYVKSVDKQSVWLDKTLKNWIGHMDYAQREAFVEALFSVLEEANIRTVDDLANLSFVEFMELMKTRVIIDKQCGEIMSKSIRRLMKEGNDLVKHSFKKKMERKL